MKKAAREVAAFFEKKGKGGKGTGWLAPGRVAPLQLRQRCLGWTNRC